MISRRNIRVKVMQTLYAIDSFSTPVSKEEAIKMLKKKIDESKELFVYLIYFVIEVARYSETDARHKASKHLPSYEDLHVNTRIAGNELLWKTLENTSFSELVKDYKFYSFTEQELIKKFYQQLIATPEYKDYTELNSRNKKSERRILEFIFTDILLPSEDFTTHIEEHFLNRDDDAEMMHSLVLNYFNKQDENSFRDFITEEKMEFAKNLLTTVIDKSEVTLNLIKPRLKNWDADRIAALDLIILQMGVCEFLYFETIPTRVTINEYIDLAKAYSTEQSGQFVNGLLDNINKDLSAENKIEKQKYKNSTL